MNTLLQRAGNLYKKLCVVILALMVVIVFTNTMLRYFFHSGIAQTEEILRYLFIWLSFLGIIAVYKQHGHICVTLLTERLSPKAAAGVAILVNIMILAAFAVLMTGSVGYMGESASMVGELTGLPYRYIILAILLASVCCFGFAIRDLLRSLRTATGHAQPSGNAPGDSEGV